MWVWAIAHKKKNMIMLNHQTFAKTKEAELL